MNKEKWEIKKLEEVAQITMGQSPTSDTYNEEGDGIPFFQGNVDFGKTYPKIRVFTTKPTKVVGTNELLISVRAPIGAINISNCECCIGRGLAGIKPKKNSLDLGFLTYTLKFHSQNLQDKGTGSTFKAINKNILTDLEIPIPPLSTQEKIVSELDTLHRLKELQEQQLAELDNLAQSTFYHLFGDPIENEKGWEVRKLGEVCEFNNGKAHEKVIDEKGRYIVINSKFIATDGKVAKRTNEQLFPLKIGEIAMVMSDVPNGRAIAKCFIVDKNDLYSLNQRICSLKSKHFNIVFMYYLINRHRYFLSFDNGDSQTNLRKDDILNCELFLPPLSLQTQFSERIEKIETQKELIKQSIGETQLLIDYTMDKYFG